MERFFFFPPKVHTCTRTSPGFRRTQGGQKGAGCYGAAMLCERTSQESPLPWAFPKSWWDFWSLRSQKKPLHSQTDWHSCTCWAQSPYRVPCLCFWHRTHEPCFSARQIDPGNNSGLDSCLHTTTNTSVRLIFYFSIWPLNFFRAGTGNESVGQFLIHTYLFS